VQNLMLQRGVAQQYQGSTLAPLATDTAILFSQVLESFQAAAQDSQLPWPPAPAADTPQQGSSSSSSTCAADANSSSQVKDSRMASFEAVLSAQLPQGWPPQALPLLQLTAYARYQLCHCYCLAAVCGAEVSLSSNRAGQAVSLAQLAVNLCGQLQGMGLQQAALLDPCNALGMQDSSRRLGLEELLATKAAHVLNK
jgi:hypothetical protein